MKKQGGQSVFTDEDMEDVMAEVVLAEFKLRTAVRSVLTSAITTIVILLIATSLGIV